MPTRRTAADHQPSPGWCRTSGLPAARPRHGQWAPVLAEASCIRLTGLSLKLEQDILGERFIDAVVERRGQEFVERLWTGPETMPTMAEIRDPDAWITRMETSGTP